MKQAVADQATAVLLVSLDVEIKPSVLPREEKRTELQKNRASLMRAERKKEEPRV